MLNDIQSDLETVYAAYTSIQETDDPHELLVIAPSILASIEGIVEAIESLDSRITALENRK